jgi:hypothetical protein
MSVEQTRVVDMIAENADDDEACLIITDHLEWGSSQPDHLLVLQEKINSYISFFESGEVFEGREHLRNRRLKLKVIGLYPLNAQAQEFYDRAGSILSGIGLPLIFELNEHALG